MIRFVRSFPGRLWRAVRRRPRTTVLAAAILLVVGGAAAFYGYAVREWRQAVAAVRDGRPADARKNLGVCLRVWPNDPQVRRLAARAARMGGDFATAEEHLNACLRLEGGATEDTQLEFLLIRAQTGEVEEVANLLFAYVDRQHPDARLIVETIALIYIYHLRYGPAYAALKRWTDEFPDDAHAYHYRGWVLERLNHPKPARADYLRALELDPGLYRARVRVAEIYLEEKEPQNALPHLEWLIAHHPDLPEAQARLGQCRFLEGEHAEARQLLEAAVLKLPGDPAVLIHLARLDLQDKEAARAEERLRRALALDPSDNEARYVLVMALQHQRKTSEAKAELAEFERHKTLLERANHLLQQEAKSSSSSDPQAAWEIGTLLLQIRQERQGLYWMDVALTRDPDHAPSHRALAEYFEQKGEQERAAAHRRRLIK